MPLIHRQPVPILSRQVPPRAARPGPEQDPVDRAPVISPPAPAPGVTRQQRLKPRPLLILKIMTGNHSKVIYTPPGSRSRKHALGEPRGAGLTTESDVGCAVIQPDRCSYVLSTVSGGASFACRWARRSRADAGIADRTGLGHEGRLLLGHAQHVRQGSGDGRRIVTRPARGCGSRLAGQAVPGGFGG
jgi:hypothetical protein